VKPWELVYFISVYISVFICLISTYKIAATDGWRAGRNEFLILLGFAVAYWLLESMAYYSAPYYIYPEIFPDAVTFFDFSPWATTPVNDCTIKGPNEISLTVPFLEMSMTYCLMWTARLLLKTHGWATSPHATATAPFIVGLMALALDGFLDPIFSKSFHCLPATLNHDGMGFWHWSANGSMANNWYGIPMFNYGAWYAAPVALVTLVLLSGWIYQLLLYLKGLIIGPPHPRPSILNGLFQIAVILAFIALRWTMPEQNPPYIQVSIMLVIILISFAIVAYRFGTYERHNPFRWEFVVPLVVIFMMPMAMLLFSSTFDLTQDWFLLLTTLALTVTGIIFAFSPYSDTWLLPAHSPRHTAEIAAAAGTAASSEVDSNP
jgi:hypothetical protein